MIFYLFIIIEFEILLKQFILLKQMVYKKENKDNESGKEKKRYNMNGKNVERELKMDVV